MRIILASSSLRRREMLDDLNIKYEIIPSKKEEFVDSYSSPSDLVMKLAKMKGEDVFNNNQDALVLSFDTLVFKDGEVLGKPQNEKDLIRMVKLLSNNTHQVITGFYMKSSDYEFLSYGKADVHMLEMSEEDIINYSKTKEPYDKAGGYAIQGYIGRFIDRIDGDYFSVVGMPKALVYKKIREYLDR